MGDVMYSYELTKILRHAAPEFRVEASGINGYREAGIYFGGKFVTHCERNCMDDVERVEQDPWFPAKQYHRSSWKTVLRALTGSAAVPLAVRRRVWKFAEKFGWHGFLRPDARRVLVGL